MQLVRILSFMFLIFCGLLCCNKAAFAAPETSTSNIQAETQPNETSEAVPLQKKAAPKTGKSSSVGWLSSLELWLSLSVLCFGLITLAIEITVIKSGAFKPDDSIKLLAVTLIVISTLFIITAGFDSEQIAPAMGLFGTVAGYMLGKATPNKEG